MKIKLLISIILFLHTLSLYGQNDSAFKYRLPNEINSYQPSIIPVVTPDGKKLYFDRKLHPENAGGIYDSDDIWFSENINGIWTEAINQGKPLNTRFEDLIFTISPDGTKALAYGVYSHNIKKKGFSFLTKNSQNIWQIGESLNILNFYNDSSNFYASLSGDGKFLLLALARKDSYGSLDLYVSTRDTSNIFWTEPKNLGNKINTQFSEESPFLGYDNKTLYFSSDKKNGEGKQDLYITRRLDDSWEHWSDAVNLGKPFNTGFDENSFYASQLADSAYIISGDSSTKRKGIYLIKIPDSLKPAPYAIICGCFHFPEKFEKNKFTVSFEIKSKNGNYTNQYSTHSISSYVFVLPESDIYSIIAHSDGFPQDTFEIDTKYLKKPEYIFHNISFKNQDSILIATILFQYDSYALNDSLIKIISGIADENKFDSDALYYINGHTDSSGTDIYNFGLSTKRAEVVKEIFIKKGINKNKLKVSAFGKSQLKTLSDAENRRVEIYLKRK